MTDKEWNDLITVVNRHCKAVVSNMWHPLSLLCCVLTVGCSCCCMRCSNLIM